MKTIDHCSDVLYHVRQLKCEYERELKWHQTLNQDEEINRDILTLEKYILQLDKKITKIKMALSRMHRISTTDNDYEKQINDIANEEPSIWYATVRS
jgi:hypothetical protein